MVRRLTLVTVAVLVLALVVTACARQAPAPAPKPAPASPAPAAPAPAPKPTAAPAPKPTAAPAPKPAAPGVSAADFYKNNPLTILVGSAAGGGTDYTARMFASFWGDITGGAAKVQNMPGGGGAAVLNHAAGLKPDGQTIVAVVTDTHVIVPWATKASGVKFDARKFTWIGSIAEAEKMFFVSSKKPYKTLADIPKTEPFKFGVSAPQGMTSMQSALVAEVLGLTKAAIVTGFPGTAEAALGAGKGELDGMVASKAGSQMYVQQGYIKPPFAALQNKRSKWFPDAPALPEAVKLTADQQRILTILENMNAGFAYMFAAEGVPADRVQFVREAFMKMAALGGLKQLYALQWPVWDGPRSGEEMTKVIKAALDTPQGDVDLLNNMVKKYLSVK